MATVENNVMSVCKPLPAYNQDGLTLVENLVAMTIFALGMLGTTSLVITIIQGNTFSHALTTATILAQNKLEDVRASVYTSITNESETVVEGKNVPYTRTLDVSDNLPASGMKTVEIVVTWSSRARRQHRVSLKTIVADVR